MDYLVVTNVCTFLLLICVAKRCCKYKKQSKSFECFVENMNIGYYKYEYRSGVILEVNSGFGKIFDLDMSVKEVIGRPLDELFIEGDNEEDISLQLEQGVNVRNYEYHFKTLTGRNKYVLYSSHITKGRYNGERIIEVLIEDRTEERLSYEKMKESQERYEKLFKNSGDMVMVCSLDNFECEEANPITEVLTGFSEEELQNRLFEDIFHPSHRKKLKEAKQDLIFTGTATLETVLVCKNGMYKEVLMTMSLLKIKDKSIVIAVIKDISAIVKKSEEETKRKKEMEDFCKAASQREERIKVIRTELEAAKRELEQYKKEYEKD